MPSHTNANGDIFGGWLLSQMDLGGAVLAKTHAMGRVVTVAVDSMAFIRPVKVGALLSCYASVKKIGRTSISIDLEAWVSNNLEPGAQIVTSGCFTYVAVDESGMPRDIK